jgi:ribonuclease D
MNGKEVSQLPMRKYDGPVQLIESEQDLSQAVRVIGSEQIVGLDTETKPAFRKGEYYLPSLIQIAASSAVYLFQLKRMDFSSALREILENPAIIKAGIGVADDLLNLNKVFEFSPERILDLSLIAQRNGIKRSGVRNLAGRLLGFRISKGASTSNWARPELTQRQTDYAATDAWVCRELFLQFQEIGFLDSKGRQDQST